MTCRKTRQVDGPPSEPIPRRERAALGPMTIAHLEQVQAIFALGGSNPRPRRNQIKVDANREHPPRLGESRRARAAGATVRGSRSLDRYAPKMDEEKRDDAALQVFQYAEQLL